MSEQLDERREKVAMYIAGCAGYSWEGEEEESRTAWRNMAWVVECIVVNDPTMDQCIELSLTANAANAMGQTIEQWLTK